jgi:hypothetical protein
MFLQILEVEEDAIPTELRPVLLSRNMHAIQEVLNENQRGVRSRFVSKETNLHESVHIAQAIIYPFMRWYSILALRYIFEIFGEMSIFSQMTAGDDSASFTIPAFKVLDADFGVLATTQRSFFRRSKHQIEVYSADNPAMAEKEPLIYLNIIDLLENAASVIECKLSTGTDFPTWVEFSRWSKRNPCYTNIIDFVGRYLDDRDLALRVFCAMVQVSFETSKPVASFGYLLGTLKHNLVMGHLKVLKDQREPCRWIELFDMYFEKLPFEEPDYGNVETKRLFRFDRFRTSEFRIGEVRHPIIGHFADLWGRLEKDDIAYRYAFTAPNGYRRQIQTIGNVFTQPIAVIKFRINGENIVVISGDLQATGLSMSYAENTVKGSLLTLLTVVGAVRRFANALMDTDFRLCHHESCPHYAANLCNMWPIIPAKHTECGFPSQKEFLQATLGAEVKDRPSLLQLKFPWDVQR